MDISLKVPLPQQHIFTSFARFQPPSNDAGGLKYHWERYLWLCNWKMLHFVRALADTFIGADIACVLKSPSSSKTHFHTLRMILATHLKAQRERVLWLCVWHMLHLSSCTCWHFYWCWCQVGGSWEQNKTRDRWVCSPKTSGCEMSQISRKHLKERWGFSRNFHPGTPASTIFCLTVS